MLGRRRRRRNDEVKPVETKEDVKPKRAAKKPKRAAKKPKDDANGND